MKPDGWRCLETLQQLDFAADGKDLRTLLQGLLEQLWPV